MTRWIRQKKYWVGAATVIVAATVFGTIRLARSAPKLPMATVQQKEFVDYVEVRGAVKALKSTVVTAPAGSGGSADPEYRHQRREGKKRRCDCGV